MIPSVQSARHHWFLFGLSFTNQTLNQWIKVQIEWGFSRWESIAHFLIERDTFWVIWNLCYHILFVSVFLLNISLTSI
jgi:hypothetical protein